MLQVCVELGLFSERVVSDGASVRRRCDVCILEAMLRFLYR